MVFPTTSHPQKTNGWKPQQLMIWVDVFPLPRLGLFQVPAVDFRENKQMDVSKNRGVSPQIIHF